MRFKTHDKYVTFGTMYLWTCGDGCCSETEYDYHTFDANTEFNLWPEYDRIVFDDGVPMRDEEYVTVKDVREYIAAGRIIPIDETAIEWAKEY